MKKTLTFLSTFLLLFLFQSVPLAQGGDVSIGANDVTFSANPAPSGGEIKIYVKIHNNSAKDTKGIVKFYDEFSKLDIGNDTPFTLVASTSQTIFTEVTFNGYGEHKIAVRIIPFDESGDNSENNKVFTKIFVDGDLDKDGIADSIDADKDGDGIDNLEDIFPEDKNEWEDTDDDGIGNNTDDNDDNDAVTDVFDALPLDPNETMDTDNDGIGNNTDDDDDNDGISDIEEILTDPLKSDSDGDGINDKEDKFPLDTKRNIDTDDDDISNFDDRDDDNDGVLDDDDDFPLDANEQEDSDGDGIGNNTDTDDDDDGWDDEYEINISKTDPLYADSDKDGSLDPKDLFPSNPNEWKDSDSDGIGDNEDTDDDNDGILDNEDEFPFNPNESKDNDKDGTGDNEDTDDDNDDILDKEDVFPFDSSEWKDSDNDGLGDNADPNDDNKGPIIKIKIPVKISRGEKVILSSIDSYDEDGVIIKTEWESSSGQKGEGEFFEARFFSLDDNFIKVKITDDKGESREEIITVNVEMNWDFIFVLVLILTPIIVGFIFFRRKFKKIKI